MLGDRNLFAVELSAPRVLAAARELDRSAAAAAARETVAGVMRSVDDLIARLETARNKIAVAAGVLNAAVTLNPALAVTQIGEPQTRLDATMSVIDAIDRFVGGTVPRMSARIAAAPEAEALVLARRLREAATNILRAAGDVDPINDAVEDVKQLAVDVVKTATKAASSTTRDVAVIVVGVAVIAAIVLARDLLR
jgi:hypothetical protein